MAMSYAKALESQKEPTRPVQVLVACERSKLPVLAPRMDGRLVAQKLSATPRPIDAEDVRIMAAANYCDHWETEHPGGIY